MHVPSLRFLILLVGALIGASAIAVAVRGEPAAQEAEAAGAAEMCLAPAVEAGAGSGAGPARTGGIAVDWRALVPAGLPGARLR